jgi:hypothetical protein
LSEARPAFARICCPQPRSNHADDSKMRHMRSGGSFRHAASASVALNWAGAPHAAKALLNGATRHPRWSPSCRVLRQLSCSGSRGLRQPSRAARKDMPQTCVFSHAMLPGSAPGWSVTHPQQPCAGSVARAGGAGRTAWVAAARNACGDVASRRQRSWQRRCARSQRTDRHAGSSARSGGAHRAGCSTCAAPFPNAHPWHRTHRRTEVTVDHVNARLVQRSLERSGGGARCASRCAASAPPKPSALAAQPTGFQRSLAAPKESNVQTVQAHAQAARHRASAASLERPARAAPLSARSRRCSCRGLWAAAGPARGAGARRPSVAAKLRMRLRNGSRLARLRPASRRPPARAPSRPRPVARPPPRAASPGPCAPGGPLAPRRGGAPARRARSGRRRRPMRSSVGPRLAERAGRAAPDASLAHPRRLAPRPQPRDLGRRAAQGGGARGRVESRPSLTSVASLFLRKRGMCVEGPTVFPGFAKPLPKGLRGTARWPIEERPNLVVLCTTAAGCRTRHCNGAS